LLCIFLYLLPTSVLLKTCFFVFYFRTPILKKISKMQLLETWFRFLDSLTSWEGVGIATASFLDDWWRDTKWLFRVYNGISFFTYFFSINSYRIIRIIHRSNPLQLIKEAYECSGNRCDSFRYYSFNYEFKKQAIFPFFFISTIIKLLVPKRGNWCTSDFMCSRKILRILSCFKNSSLINPLLSFFGSMG
jgi:hypothetical protein